MNRKSTSKSSFQQARRRKPLASNWTTQEPPARRSRDGWKNRRRAMPEPHSLHPRHVRSRTEHGVVVLTITEPQLLGDTLVHALRQELLAVVARPGTHKIGRASCRESVEMSAETC